MSDAGGRRRKWPVGSQPEIPTRAALKAYFGDGGWGNGTYLRTLVRCAEQVKHGAVVHISQHALINQILQPTLRRCFHRIQQPEAVICSGVKLLLLILQVLLHLLLLLLGQLMRLLLRRPLQLLLLLVALAMMLSRSLGIVVLGSNEPERRLKVACARSRTLVWPSLNIAQRKARPLDNPAKDSTCPLSIHPRLFNVAQVRQDGMNLRLERLAVSPAAVGAKNRLDLERQQLRDADQPRGLVST